MQTLEQRLDYQFRNQWGNNVETGTVCVVTGAYAVQLLGMDDDHWVWPDRRDLYHACAALADPEVSVDRAGEAADMLLNDLELYDDPRHGQGLWLFLDEVTIADDLETKLHTATTDEPLENWGHAVLRHPLWRGWC